ncbi:MAG: UDP-glucose 4-epimerase GalE [Candidatus Melainabacteria bacterium]
MNAADKSILVTGGAGYIGSHCVQQLLADGRRVVVLDDLSTGFRELILTDDFVEGSTRDADVLARIFRRHDIGLVMHFAASAYVGESVTDPARYYENNVLGTLSLLQAMRRAGVNRMVFSSSCAVYGEPAALPLTEDHPLSPVNPYGFTKRVAEAMLADFARAYDFRSVSLRYFNAAGADPHGRLGEMHDPETHLIPCILQVVNGDREAVTVYGADYDTPDGTCIRDYIHVEDIAQAHRLAMAHLEGGGESRVYNLGTSHGHSVREVIAICRAVTGAEIPVREAPRRPGDPPRLTADAGRITRELGWKPAYTRLDAMVETAWRWHNRKNLLSLPR